MTSRFWRKKTQEWVRRPPRYVKGCLDERPLGTLYERHLRHCGKWARKGPRAGGRWRGHRSPVVLDDCQGSMASCR